MKKTMAILLCAILVLSHFPVAALATEEIIPLEQNIMPETVKANKPYKIVFTMFNGKNTIARDIESGMLGAAKEAGVELWVMDNQLDPVVMNANVDMAVAAGDVDFYILYTNDQASNPQLMDKLVAGGVKAGSIATQAIAADGTRAPQFNVPDFDSAFHAAQSLALAAKEKGWNEEEVVFFEMGFDEAGGPFLKRNEGAYAGVKSVYTNIEIVDSSSTGDAEVAFQRTLDYLQTLPKDKKFLAWTHSDDMSASMLAAIMQAGRAEDSLLLSNGLSRQMINMLREPDGVFIGSMDIKYDKWGYFWMPHIVAFLNDGTPLPKIIHAPFELITPENVDEKYPR